MSACYSNNNLGLATSLYLLQHKDHPVAWQFWEDEVLAQAKQQDKPILLSIGYSACHWCHVMARDSFADGETAQLMNDMFINIKVDREERPDLDSVYQIAHQLLTGQPGGWPLTVFLCPRSRLPFLVGTYFPKEGNNGRMAFKDLLLRVNDYYHSRGKDFLSTLDQVKKNYQALTERQATFDPDANLSLAPVDEAVGQLLQKADTNSGGFGTAPKFPMPINLERLFLAGTTNGALQTPARQHLQRTLKIMARSGINDQVGGGFFRYSTDACWMIPHFEKMLSDNGLLLTVYAEAWSLLGDPLLQEAAHGIARWALREMRAESGAFYGSLDADSGEKEGAYYTWTATEIDRELDARASALIHTLYELDRYPNFHGQWHLHRERDWAEVVSELELEESEARALLVTAHEKLRAAREQRPAPERGNKTLTASNALMIRGLATAARVFGDREYLLAAQRSVDFIRDNVWVNQRLHATWQNGKAKIPGYLDDYAFLIDALLELLRIEWRDDDYRFAALLAESLIDHFEDREEGGFYLTAHDHEQLIFRSKPYTDTATPAGNGIAAKILVRLGHLSGEPRYLDCARRALLNGWASLNRQPAEHHSLLQALEEYLSPPPQVLLKGSAGMDEWRHYLQQQYGEQVHCYWVPEDSEIHPSELFLLEGDQGLVCAGGRCLEPRNHLPALATQLDEILSGQLPADEE